MIVFFGWILIIIGLFFIFSGVIGFFRFRDFYSKLHAASVIECCGIPFTLIGLALIQNQYQSSFKLVAIAILIVIVNPVSTYALGRASVLFKIDSQGRIK